MKISDETHQLKRGTIAAMQQDRYAHWTLWRELADYYLPRRYVWLQSDAERRVRNAKNPYILDGTGTIAARTLASGMMNGITSPTRPWFKLRIPGFASEENSAIRRWLDEVERRMFMVMAESNFYNAMAVMYLDLSVFGTSAMLIYEDPQNVIRCFNPALGEFYLGQNAKHQGTYFAREFTWKVHQVVEEFGLENCSTAVRDLYNRGGPSCFKDVDIVHLIEPNIKEKLLPKKFAYRELFWERGGQVGELLAIRGYNELPGLFPRWDTTANDSYGASPGMDALGDVIQLQHETKKKAQALDKLVSPPVVMDVSLENKPIATMPNGVTFVREVNNAQARALYTVNPPIGEMTLDIREVQQRIRETFHNDLFKMISQLDTVRSATEIDARREEKLVLLGPVLERFENEGLDPAINRIFSIMARRRLLPPAPPEIEDAQLEIQYVSILSAAQRAVGVIPTERWMGLIANIAPVYPKAVNIPNWDSLIRNYGSDLGVAARDINDPETTAELNRQADELAQMREAAQTGPAFTQAAQQLSETEVGGGANALQMIIGG